MEETGGKNLTEKVEREESENEMKYHGEWTRMREVGSLSNKGKV